MAHRSPLRKVPEYDSTSAEMLGSFTPGKTQTHEKFGSNDKAETVPILGFNELVSQRLIPNTKPICRQLQAHDLPWHRSYRPTRRVRQSQPSSLVKAAVS